VARNSCELALRLEAIELFNTGHLSKDYRRLRFGKIDRFSRRRTLSLDLVRRPREPFTSSSTDSACLKQDYPNSAIT
jgi:hypothetical protein